MLAGLLLGGYVVWQVWGTNLLSTRVHRELVTDTREAWEAGTESHEVGPVVTRHGSVSAVIRIPRFGPDYAVPVLEGTSGEVLAAGFGRFVSGAGPGEPGNFAVAGHRITHGEPLRDLPTLRRGDEVIVETRDWSYTYVMVTSGNDLTVASTDGWVLDDVPRNPAGGPQPDQVAGQRLLTLVTCSELFATDRRLVAFGRLEGKVAAVR